MTDADLVVNAGLAPLDTDEIARVLDMFARKGFAVTSFTIVRESVTTIFEVEPDDDHELGHACH